MTAFKIPPAKPGKTVPFCKFLNIHGKMKPCKEKPQNCVLGFRVKVSTDGRCADPVDQTLNHEKVVIETIKNCPKLKALNRKVAREIAERLSMKKGWTQEEINEVFKTVWNEFGLLNKKRGCGKDERNS